jgi:acetolactate synthase-1/2/3 large subunit
VRTLDDAANMGAAAAECIAAAIQPPGQVSTLIVPADYSWSPSGAPGAAVERPARRFPSRQAIGRAADVLRRGKNVAILLGGSAISEQRLRAAARTGARVYLNRYAARAPRGREWAFAQRVPYFPEPAEAMLDGITDMILVEAEPPVSFFGYPGRRSTVAPEECRMHVLAAEGEDGVAALESLPQSAAAPAPLAPAEAPPVGELTPESIGLALAALLPEGSIVSDEMVSSGEAVNAALQHAASHDLLPVTGGSIGQGLPVAVGAALACPGRKVFALEADGSAMYSLQALWTMAREGLDVVVVVFNNRRYRILDVEMRRTAMAEAGPLADRMIDIGQPAIDWVRLSEALGVEASRASTNAEFVSLLDSAIRHRGPRLIEAVLPA